jgi:phospholipid/cholesterol/gamma-HCH transport system ATP-binding protein
MIPPVALIEFRGVHKAFGPKVVYAGLDLQVQRGETLTIIGGSGSGKSVMLRCLIGLMRPDGGSIVFDGREVTTMDAESLRRLRRRVAMLFQGAALFDSLRVEDNVAYPLREHGLGLTRDAIAERVALSLERVGLPGIERMMPADLSGGMRKRVGLARAIAIEPEVILYDEPTTGLDPISTTRINHLIVELKRRLAVTSIVVTHDMASAFYVSDRLAMLHQGRILTTGTADEFRASPLAEVQRFIRGDLVETESTATWVPPSPDGLG